MFTKATLLLLIFSLSTAIGAETDVWIESRGVQIPATFSMPEIEDGKTTPLVVLVHGHGGSRQENGGFTELAALLAEIGIASVRMDFPGCGESTEAFIHNNITNMLHDIDASLAYAIAQPGIDSGRVGILGYSMGGRLAMLSASERYAAMALWAPVAKNGAEPMVDYLGGREAYDRTRAVAKAEGFVRFVTPWGAEQELGWQWFEDMESSSPLTAINDYRGAVLILHGLDDRAVTPDNSEAAEKAASGTRETTLIRLEGADHGFGFFSPDPLARGTVLASTVEFFRTELLAGF